MKKKILLIAASIMAMALVGCGGNKETEEKGYKDDVSVTAIQEAVVEAVTEQYYWPNADVPAEMLPDMFGLKEETYSEILAQTPAIMTNVDTLIVVKANKDNVDDVMEALTAYQTRIKADTMQYPMNIPKIQAGQLKQFGNYVVFVQLGADKGMDDMDATEEDLIEMYMADNQKALDAIEKVLAK